MEAQLDSKRGFSSLVPHLDEGWKNFIQALSSMVHLKTNEIFFGILWNVNHYGFYAWLDSKHHRLLFGF